jgi:stearoyl-CoA desaturase (Delta-9 desaturase)
MALTICFTEMNQLQYWAVLHNIHHDNCDALEDIHSPVHKGFWSVQMTYFMLNEEETMRLTEKQRTEGTKKLKSAYENDLSWITPQMNFAMVVMDNLLFLCLGFLIPGWTPMSCWYYLSLCPRFYTTMVASLTNSACHMFGSKPYVLKGKRKDCNSTNCWWAALLGGGEGWHNNHHAFALSARHGFRWYEIDTVFFFLCILGYLGVVWNILVVSEEVKNAPIDSDFSKFDQKYVKCFSVSHSADRLK